MFGRSRGRLPARASFCGMKCLIHPPWWDAWYLEQDFTSSAAAASAVGQSPMHRTLPAHDDWRREGLRSGFGKSTGA
jgi:hypothetical protein